MGGFARGEVQDPFLADRLLPLCYRCGLRFEEHVFIAAQDSPTKSPRRRRAFKIVAVLQTERSSATIAFPRHCLACRAGARTERAAGISASGVSGACARVKFASMLR